MAKGIELVKINEERAKEVFQILDDFWRAKRGVFSDVVLPQDAWPTPNIWQTGFKDDRDKANWLFYVALPMRGGVVSEVPFRLWWNLKIKRPELFDPNSASDFEAREIEKFLRNAIIENFKGDASKLKSMRENGQPFGFGVSEHSKSWVHNSGILKKFWDGNILNVFSGVGDFEEAFARIDYKQVQVGRKKGIMGMRRKIFSLLTIWLQEKGLIPVFPTPIPFDFHAQKISWATEMIEETTCIRRFSSVNGKYPKYLEGKDCIIVTESFMDVLAVWSQKFMQKNGFSHLVINPALWILGRRLCKKNFQNKTWKDATIYIGDKLKKNPHLWPKNYKNPCDFCPLEHLCNWSIPSGPYYNKWTLLVRGSRRVSPPSQKLPFPGWKEQYPFNSK